MISSQKFIANIASFRKLDETARSLIAETAAYCLHQWHAHGNKDPHVKLMASDMPGWIKDAFKKLTLGKRDKLMTAKSAEMRGDVLAADALESQAEKRAARKAQNEARKEADAAIKAQNARTTADPDVVPEPELADVPTVLDGEAREVALPESALVIGGEVVEMTSAEADSVFEFLMSLRKPALKAA